MGNNDRSESTLNVGGPMKGRVAVAEQLGMTLIFIWVVRSGRLR